MGPLLGDIRVHTLVLHRRHDTLVPAELGRNFSEKDPPSDVHRTLGSDHLSFAGDLEEYLDEVEEFLTGERRHREPDRVLATILFTDLVDSTRRTAELGELAGALLVSGRSKDTVIDSGIDLENRGITRSRACRGTGACSRLARLLEGR